MTRKEKLEKYLKEKAADKFDIINPLIDDVIFLESQLESLKKYPCKYIVVDPVMISKSGYSLLRPEAKENLIKYLILTPMLLSAFVIDYRQQIIPNRLNLTMFEIGLIIAFLYGMSNVAITVDMLLGMLVGGGIFLAITLVGSLIYGKEALGFGDVKLMGALGLYFGVSNILAISAMSFLIGAILGIILIVTKIKKSNEYIPFGPFIVIATFISIFVPFDILLKTLLVIFTLGTYKAV